MIKHLPEGLTPFRGGGFSRTPLDPLAGQAITVYCRVDNQDVLPSLNWAVDGIFQASPTPKQEKERYYSFDLGSFDHPVSVSYHIEARKETTREFAFEVLEELHLANPSVVSCAKDGLKANYTEGYSLDINYGKGITLTFRSGIAENNSPMDAHSIELGDGFSISVQTQPFSWELKRLSETIAAFSGQLKLLVDRKGQPHQISYSLILPGSAVFGLGEKFNGVNQRGKKVLSRVVEKFTHQEEHTYLPIPFFFTEMGFGCLVNTARTVALDFREGVCLSHATPREGILTELCIFQGSPKDMLKQLHEKTGQAVLPPRWAFGPWISANGWNTDQEVSAQLDSLIKHDYPATVMVLEAWSDERTFSRWNGAGNWRDPKELVKRVRSAGLHLVLWQIPIVKYEWDGSPGEALLTEEAEAIQNGYCVLNEDGTPYRITENWFHNSLLLDFTNPKAADWWFKKRKHLLDMGVEGFKTDGGEFLFDRDCRLSDGSRGDEAHNLYPNQYVSAYRDFMAKNGVEGVLFSRAGYTGAQTMPIHWAGDQQSDWAELKGQLSAGLSLGLSGIPFWGFDIGGFSGELPDKELYLRATAMAAFCPIMQWHAEPRYGQFEKTYGVGFNNDRSPWNLAEFWNDPEIISIARDFAKKRMEMLPYLYEEAVLCVRTSRPLMAHPCYDFPEDKVVWTLEDEYMLGRKYLVAPIVSQGQTTRNVYLPEGTWRDIYLNRTYQGMQRMTYACPLDRIPVFERMDG